MKRNSIKSLKDNFVYFLSLGLLSVLVLLGILIQELFEKLMN